MKLESALLLEATDRLSGSPGQARRLADALEIDLDWASPRPPGLNEDGTPIEICVTCEEERYRCRFIGDPDPELRDAEARLVLFARALRQVAGLCGAETLVDTIERATQAWVPSDPEGIRKVAERILWIAAGIDSPGIGIYLDGRVAGLRESWSQAEDWLRGILPDPAPALAFTEAFSGRAGLGGVGIEGLTPAYARVKFHWQLIEPASLDRLGLPLIGDDAIRRFLDLMVHDRPLRHDVPFFSAAFDLTTGALSDVKLDLCGCGHCLAYTAEEWADRLALCCQEFGLALPPVRDDLLAGNYQGALLGFGVDVKGRGRLNFYLKERITAMA